MIVSLAIAVLCFIGMHVFISSGPPRAWLVARLGEGGYLGLFSAASALVLGWMIWTYVAVREVVPTQVPRPLAWALVGIAILLIVMGLMSRPPTVVGGARALDADEPARGVHRITRHPFLWGVAIWGATHAAYNPQPAGLWFFGGLCALGLIGPPLIDAKLARRHGAKWERYAAATSSVPFAAIVQGRNRLVVGELVPGLLAGAAVFALLLWAHGRLFGIPAL